MFRECISLTSVHVGKDVKEIGNEAFEGCTSLTSLNLPTNLNTIGYGAFGNCKSLTSIAFPDNVKLTGANSFAGCTSLKSIDFGKVNEISKGSFRDCTSLVSIVIPANTNIEEDAFNGCDALDSIKTLSKTPSNISETAFDDRTYVEATLYVPTPSAIIRYNSASGWKNFFNIKSAAETEEGESANDIMVDGIYYSFNVESSRATVTYGESKYSGEIKIPYFFVYEGKNIYVESISDNAFKDCVDLTSLHIARGVEFIGFDVFKGCCSLTNLVIEGINILEFATAYPFAECPIKTLSLGRDCYRIENGKSVHDGIFSDMKSLETIIIAPTTPVLLKEAFWGCTKLKSVYCMNSRPCRLDDETFENTHYLNVKLYVPEGSLKAYQAADGWKNFRDIEEFDATGIEGVEAELPATNGVPTDIYTLSGKKVSETQKGQMYISRYGNGKAVKKLVK